MPELLLEKGAGSHGLPDVYDLEVFCNFDANSQFHHTIAYMVSFKGTSQYIYSVQF